MLVHILFVILMQPSFLSMVSCYTTDLQAMCQEMQRYARKGKEEHSYTHGRKKIVTWLSRCRMEDGAHCRGN